MRIKLSDAVNAKGKYITTPWDTAQDVAYSVASWDTKPTKAEQKALKRHTVLLTETTRRQRKAHELRSVEHEPS